MELIARKEAVMSTMTMPVVETGPPRTRRPWWVLVAVAAVSVALGAVGGWWAAGEAGDDESPVVVAGGAPTTQRQEQMADLLDDYMAAWRSGDGEAVAAFYAPGGEFVVASLVGTEVMRADDGSLAAYVEQGSWASKVHLTPVLVHGDSLTCFYSYAGTRVATVDFTSSGEVLIVRNTVFL